MRPKISFEVANASIFGLLLAIVLFSIWAPEDALFELRAVIKFLNHLI